MNKNVFFIVIFQYKKQINIFWFTRKLGKLGIYITWPSVSRKKVATKLEGGGGKALVAGPLKEEPFLRLP